MIDTLIIVGNGLDCWQGLHTEYSDYQRYYLANRARIIKELSIHPIQIKDEDGSTWEISDVELLYGDRDYFTELESDFWNTFESSLADIDDEGVNMFFGKTKKDLRRLKQCARNSRRILTKAFCEWIATKHIDKKDSVWYFGDNVLFINFNYTDTLEKRLGVNLDNIYHIHGEASDSKSIIVGHSKHPEYPFPLLKKLGGRFEGLYYLDEFLYETDKHAQDNIQFLIQFLASHGIIVEEIKDIYVLGHSFGEADLMYFAFLTDCTSVEKDKIPSDNVMLDAVQKVYVKEQEERNKIIKEEYLKSIGTTREDIDNYVPHAPRMADAMWHISYYSEDDKERIKTVMAGLEYSNYKLYSSIDECLERYRQRFC